MTRRRALVVLPITVLFLLAAGVMPCAAETVPGVVIDHIAASSRRYIGSPGLAVLANGDYVASHDEFGPGSTEHQRAVTKVFRSRDRGETWTNIARIDGQFWSTLFVHRGNLYLIGTDKHHGNAIIRRSSDGGVTWTSPDNASTGLLRGDGQYHCAPVPMVEHAGRLWRAMERRVPPQGWGYNYRAGVLSIGAEADLLQAANWTFSEFLPSNTNWLGATFGGWLEGNVVVTRDERLVDVLRVDTTGYPEKAAIVGISPDGRRASFDPAQGFIDFPGGAKKFAIRFDAPSGLYWSLATIVPKEHLTKAKPGGVRNTLALTSSPDLTNWTVCSTILHHEDVVNHGFQYVEWLFDGDDIIAACRTAFDDGAGGAHNNHDANFLTFHRVKGFRALAAAAVPTVASTPKPLSAYRKFAMEREGDVSRGRALFEDEQKVACAKCHTVDGTGSKAGPDLGTISDKFGRRDLIESVLAPSATIADGYGTTLVETKSGEEYQGVLKQSSAAGIELIGADGQRVRVAASDIKEQRGSSVSLMPEGLQAALTVQEFADIIEYLVSLKQPAHARTAHHGMPETIPALARPVQLRPFLREPLQVPRKAGAASTNLQTGLVWFGQVPGSADRFLVVHQAGMIWLVERGSGRPTVFADFTRETFSARGPNGLLGLAFHPRFRENGKYYLKQQVMEDGRITTLAVERKASSDLSKDSGTPGRRLLKIRSVAEHHNGGCIDFGPDGFLYIGMGDSAPNFDPQGQAQDLRLLFGKMLRIDVDRPDASLEYGIPADNPYIGHSNARPEIWASGLREPWRFSFDALTGELWVADLGQERGDEVDIVRRGGNYGWNIYEGFELFSAAHRQDEAAYVAPLFSTWRRDGAAMVGGRVYRADKKSSFYGVYIFGDYQTRRMWGMTLKDGALDKVRELGLCPQSITCFSADDRGAFYVVGWEGMVYEMNLRAARFE